MNFYNWECPDAINFPKFLETLKHFRLTGFPKYPSTEGSVIKKDFEGENQLESLVRELSLKVNCMFNDEMLEWKIAFVDGFLLYWDVDIVKELDLKFFIKADHYTIKQRRKEIASN
ncbi:1630_t:CDS:1, partial [Acaulospora colombiana]